MSHPPSDTPGFLNDGGEMGARMRGHDWSQSPLGPIAGWPESLRTVVNLMLDSRFPMFIAWGEQLGFLYNDAYIVMLGSKHPQALGRRFEHIWSEIWSDIEPFIGQAMAGKASFHNDLPLTLQRHGYEERAWFTFSYSPLRGADGRVAGMFCACTETTGKVLTEQHVNDAEQARGALQLANRRKDEFLAMLAHELRNPLAPIATAAELLQVAGIGADQVRHAGAIIGRQVKHLTELVDDLLDVSRVTSGLVKLKEEKLSMNGVLQAAVEQLQSHIDAKGHTLALALPGEQLFVSGDRTRLVQIVANLLNNAAKYTPAGGRIALALAAVDDQVQLTVSDNGVGIAAALLPAIFELFTQAERSPDRAQGGLGLGLALVRSLVELQGGSVSAHSAGAGQGSRFVVRLPRVGELAADAAPAGHGAGMPAAPARKVLVVDDNIDAAATMALLLETLGHEVLVSHGALHALQQAAAHAPAVLFLDIGLPEMDGYALARRLRALPQTAHSLLVAITGYGQPEDRACALKAGFDHHLVKPVNLDEVLALLATRASGADAVGSLR